MSQRFFYAKDKTGAEREVLCGWESTSHHFFLCIYDSPEGHAMFSNLDLSNPGMSLQEIEQTLKEFGIDAPESLWTDLKEDAKNLLSDRLVLYYNKPEHESAFEPKFPLVQISRRERFRTTREMTFAGSFSIPESGRLWGSYRKDARKIIDEQSEEYNRIGLEALAAALVFELFGNGYKGEGN